MSRAATDCIDTETLRYLWTPDLDPLFWREGRSGAVSAWYGHVPFAHWIVGACKPRTLVELGTHNGVSYSAFCEAVIRNGLDTRCYAVDTWLGDDQTGHYGEGVYMEFRRFHDARYGAFSELMRCTFDDALPYIQDGSVDLLHVDGLHTYEAVRHDFESWRPKLSDSAIALFHDTNVRERDFGVWRLWEELRAQFPSFEFLHGHGLGLLAVGRLIPSEVLELCSLREPVKMHAIRERFSLLGDRWLLLAQLELQREEEVADCEARIQSLENEVEARQARIQSLENDVEARDARISALEAGAARWQTEAARRTAAEQQLRARAAQRTTQARAEAANAFARAGKAVTKTEAGFEGSLDQLEHRIANKTSYGLFISGWLYSKSLKLTQLVARVRGGANVVLTHGLPRPDIAKAFPQFPSAVASGFDGYVPIDSSFAGCVTLELHAIIEDGTELFCFQREVTLRPPGTFPPDSHPVVSLVETNPYTEWVRTNRLTPTLLKKMRRDANRIATTGPLISIVVPVYNTPGPYLEALIDSVRLQLYPNWQLCLADDASPQPHVRPILERATSTDSRIQVSLRDVNGHIVRASNSALELATGEYVGLLDHDDILSPDALLHVAEAIAAEPALDLLYTDEDKFSPSGERYDPIFKGSFSPEMAITHNYIQHFTVIRRSLLQAVRGFREGFEGAQDLDLYLRVMEKTTPERVRHLPFVCYHWRSHPESTASTGAQKNYVFESARKSIAEALVRRKLRAIPFLPDFAAEDNCCLYQLRWSRELLKENPVTIVIPTKNRDDLLEKCIASLVRTVNPAYVKLIVVDDFSEDESARRYLKELAAGKRLSCNVIRPSSRSEEFNFSQLVNEGVARATTPLVLLLNNDTEAIRPGWLEDMVGWMSIDGVGAVGAKLLYPDSTIQHAGVVVGEHGGLAEHIFHGLGKDIVGVNFLTHAARNVSAVTAACMLTSKAVFDKVKGFDEANFAMEWNDVDYCLRLGQAGKRIVFTPQAVLLHDCGKSRGCLGFRPQEHVNFLRRYRGIKDPFYNESLDLDRLPVAVKPRHFVHTGRVGKLKVLVISHNLNFEGAPRVLFDHVIFLSRFGEYQITVVSPLDGPLQNHYERASIPVIIVKDALLREEARENFTDYTQRLQRIGKRLRVEAFDLIICNTLAGFWGVTLAKLFDLPVIWHIHESASLDQFFRFDPILEPVQNCFGSADRVTFVADATRRLFAQNDSRDNFITISGSVDVGAIDEFCERHERDLLRRKHGINTDQTVVSLVGTTCRRKGQHVFLQAIRKLQLEHPSAFAEVCFLMVGARKSLYLEESLYLDFLRAQIESSGATNIRLVEEREDVYDFYRLSDIFICASFEESFPRVILEAMAFKLGIVSTNVFGIPEMISDGDEALLVSAGDACGLAQRILRLVQEPQNRKQLGDRAHARVSRCFTNRGQLRKHLDLTKEVVARHA